MTAPGLWPQVVTMIGGLIGGISFDIATVGENKRLTRQIKLPSVKNFINLFMFRPPFILQILKTFALSKVNIKT